MPAESVSKQTPYQMLVVERRELADLCATFSEADWQHPSLCEDWRVRDVVAHLVGNQHDLGDMLKKPPLKGGINAVNQRQVDKRRDWPTSRLMAEVVEITQPPTYTRLVSGVASFVLFDSWVHQQDIRWPLNKPRTQNPARMQNLLKTALNVGSNHKKVEGMRLVANDFDWSHGTGPEIVGPSEALVMMLAGRPAAWERLEGAGVVRLRPR